MKYLPLLALICLMGCHSIVEDNLIITEKRIHDNVDWEQKYRYVINHRAVFYSNHNFNVGDTLTPAHYGK
jgi:hypothetical protein